MNLRKLEEGLWVVDGTIRMMGVVLPARSSVVRLQDGSLLIFSPLPGLTALAQELGALGRVRALIAPNTMHHLGLESAHAAFPDAQMLGVRGLQAKRTDLRFTGELTGTADSAWADEVKHLAVGGMPKLQEVAFFHVPSRTLLLGDLCFNVGHSNHAFTRLFMRLNKAYGSFGASRVARSMMKDRSAVRAAVDQMLAWNPERIVMGHGDVVEKDGRKVLEEAFSFLPPGK